MTLLGKVFSITRYPEFLKLLWWWVFVPWQLKLKGINVDSTVRFYGSPVVSVARDSSIDIEAHCSICSVSEYTALGVNHPTILRTLRSSAVIRIGAHTGMSGATICAVDSIEIGSYVMLGANVMIVDTDFHALKPEGRRYNNDPNEIGSSPVVIGNNVFIGSGAIVLKGVKIGENTIIGAGAVVTRDIPANVIAAGNPARVIKTIS